MTTLHILAAGSLRGVWPDLIAAFHHQSGLTTDTHFGPAGLLRQRIEQGERCDLFASANLKHPATLLQRGLAMHTGKFSANSLCLTARRDVVTENDTWLTLLQRDDLRLATSTPLSDPSGDYGSCLTISDRFIQTAVKVETARVQLVGGIDSLAVPTGELAAQWLIDQQHADLFIGYASYAPRLINHPHLQVLSIPEPFNIQAEYGWATFTHSANPLAAFLN
ncbi:substrate-binding domain-containing protein (plasmid) [Pseudomonas silvicola]|nr:substrate-binding domain-containing protein [Pseudomonas silvicola]